MFSYLHPPFNKVSKYRDPGKVNINTIPHLPGDTNSIRPTDPSPIIWSAIQDSPGVLGGPTWKEVGYSMQNSTTWTSGSTPAMFSNPFRSFAGADYTLPGLTTAPRGIDVTLMRPDINTATAMLFDFPPPTATGTTYQGCNAPDRNSYFRYQNLQAMGNLLTTRSNVYAVWVTVGYFQVQPVTANSNIQMAIPWLTRLVRIPATSCGIGRFIC